MFLLFLIAKILEEIFLCNNLFIIKNVILKKYNETIPINTFDFR